MRLARATAELQYRVHLENCESIKVRDSSSAVHLETDGWGKISARAGAVALRWAQPTLRAHPEFWLEVAMGYASKKRGFRSIQVNSERYRWRFHHGSITLQSMDSSAQQLEITLVGWRDPWLCITGFHISEDGRTLQLQTDAANEPQVVTAKFARQAIVHGLEHGWKPNKRGQRVYCAYKDFTFGQLELTRAGS